MTIQELFPQRTDGPTDDRLPPQDLHAEQSVLGGMLLSKDAIADCVEVLRSADFYRPQHEAIFDAVLSLYGRGEPADAITVSDELGKRGDLGRVGGQAYLHQLISSVPTAANAGYYAQIVAERAVLRRLVEAGTKIVQLGYAQGGGDVEDIVNAAQAEVYAVVDKRGGDDYHRLGDILEMTVDEIEVASGKSGEMTGVPTGFTDLDSLTNGLHPGQMIVLAARPAIGKALALDTPLPTPDGWTTMGDVRVGDRVLGADGRPVRVVAATEVMNERPCYEVEFSDGSVIVADAQHQWLTETRSSRRSFQSARDARNRQRNQRTFAGIRTTEEISATLRTRTSDARLNHSVALASPLKLPEAELPLSPYVLGAWLGDGTTDAAIITTADDEILMYLEAEGLLVTRTSARMRYSLRFPKAATCSDCGDPSSGGDPCQRCRNHHGTVQALLRSMGVLGNKHIPAAYLRASETQRRALLAGLLDTDGTVSRTGSVQFTSTSALLTQGCYELVVSLGYRANVMRERVNGQTDASSIAYTVNFTCADDVFRLSRKMVRHKEVRVRRFERRNSRFIVDVRRIKCVPVRCIEVDNEDHLYLAGRSMVPTHNSTLGLDIVRSASIRHNLASVIFSLEMSKTEITMRLLSAEAGIQLQHMRKGTMREEDWTRLASTMGRVSEAPLFIDDSPNMSLMEIRAKCRRLKQRDNLKLVVIDYLQLMSSGKRVESRQQEVSEFSRALKLLAKELEVPVVAISQLNRGPEQRTDKKPQMSDLRESGCLTAETRVLRADTGAEMSIGELLASGATDIPVWSLDESLRYVPRHLTHVFSTGTRPVFRLTLASGKQVRATENHPFLTYAGWRALGELRTGDRLAVPRHVPAPDWFERPLSDEEVRMGAVLMSSRTTARASARTQVLGCRLGFDVIPAAARRLPPDIASFPKRQIALFLQSLWAVDGRTTVNTEGTDGRIVLVAKSRQLLDDVVMLLLRFGISAGVSPRRQGWELHITGVDDQRRFLQEVAVHGPLSEEAHRLLAIVRDRRERASAGVRGASGNDVADGAGAAGWPLMGDDIADELVEEGAFDLERAAELLASLDLDLEASNDVLWDEIIAVEPDGVEEVFDATVLGGHNFVANGIAVHNSIEQDADMVILLHREEAYERESPRAGEADLIVAKHRNGPTDTIVLAFQGHYSRFTNMAPSF